MGETREQARLQPTTLIVRAYSIASNKFTIRFTTNSSIFTVDTVMICDVTAVDQPALIPNILTRSIHIASYVGLETSTVAYVN